VDGEVIYQRGSLYLRLREYDLAVADFDRSLALNPYHLSALLQRGHCHRRQSKLPLAIRDYTEVLRHHPGNVPALSGRGQAYRFLGERERAIADFTEALRLEPNSASDYYHRGVAYRARGDLPLALADLDQAIRRQPWNWVALYYRGKVLLSQGQYGLALLDFTEVVRLNPTLLVAYLSRALTHDRLGKYAEGIADAGRAVELDAASPAAYLLRGVLHSHRGDRAAAIADLSEAIRLDERFALAYQERAVACMLEGDHDRALADCDQLIALEPANAQAYATRSIICHFKGEVEPALRDYARALQIDPRRVMSGWNEGLTESARNETTQRIADYIDGLRAETAVAEPPPATEIHIVLEPSPTSDVATRTAAEKATTPRTPPPKKKRPPTQPAAIQSPTVAATEAPVPEPPVHHPDSDTEADTVYALSEQAVNTAVEELLTSPEPAEPAHASESKKSEDRGGSRSRSSSPDTSRPIQRPNCERETIPTPLSESRVRCGHCQSVLPLSAIGKPPAKKKAEPVRSWGSWRKPATIAAGAAAVLLLFLVGFRGQLFGKSGRLRVHPARGNALWEGKPMANATLFLHPVGVKSPSFPRPRAVVAADGTFVLGTYRKDDGAPAGEYKVTVQWFEPGNDRAGPTNRLPARYAHPETAGLTVRIDKGENQIPTIQLTRSGPR
jgi:tetratricopeptide (TPR) repeat protein